MGDPFRKVIPSEDLNIPAEAWNALTDLAVRRSDRKLSQEPPPLREHFQHAKILNATEEPIARHHVLSITAPALTPTQNLATFSSRLALTGTTPAPGDQELAVLLEPALDGVLGRCAVSGVAPCLVEIDDEDHTCASAQAGTIPISSSRGPLKIIWKQAALDRETEGFALCLVRILGGRPAGEMFAVRCTIDGGSAGSAMATCSFTYTVKDLAGVVIGTSLTPELRRFSEVPYTTTPDDSPGEAYYDEEGDLKLFNANELPQVEEC